MPPARLAAICACAIGIAMLPASLGVGQGPGVQSQGDPVVAGHTLRHRWVYLPNNFQAEGNVQRVNALLSRAAAAGFNGAVISDVKFGRLEDDSLIPAYYTNLRAVVDHGRSLGLRLVPATAAFGYSHPILWHNPNLAEGLPVRDAAFRAQGGQLVPAEPDEVGLSNGGFETLPASGHLFPGWAFQDEPGMATFADTTTRHSGSASLRMQDLGRTNPTTGNGRIMQRLAVRPFQAFHLQVWVKTADFRGGEVRALVLGTSPPRTLQWNPIPIQPTQDWTRFDVMFNSLTHSEVLVYFGVWGGGSGTIWWDDGLIEPAGLTNLVRRPGAPMSLKSADGRVVYEEGRDVEPVADPGMGTTPYSGSYDLWHPPPPISLSPGSRIVEGATVAVSWYHMASVYGDQVTASLTEPEVFTIVGDQLAAVRRQFEAASAFTGWMLSHDEIRVHGWDEAPRFGRGSPGDNLAEHMRRLTAVATGIDAGASLFVWSDMFDPFHNAADSEEPYYLVNGNWSGSWEGLPARVGIVNWNSGPARRRVSAEFFAARGHRQILAGYYDAEPVAFQDRQWLVDLSGIPGIDGVMFTPWWSGYDHLETWAEHVWGGADVADPRARAWLPAAWR